MKILKVKVCLAVVLVTPMVFSSTGLGSNGVGENDLSKRKEFNKSVLLPADVNKQKMNAESPSRGKAFLLSFLIPGLGEYYAGSEKMAKIFLGTEIALWTTYAGLRVYGSWREKDYKNFAITHAHINPKGKEHDYFVNIEHFDDIETYNQTKLKQRDVDALYPENEEYTWKWDSKKNRLKYEQIRMSSDRSFSNSVLIIGVVVLNHIVSGIDAMRIAIKADKKPSDLKAGFIPVPEGGMLFSVVKRF